MQEEVSWLLRKGNGTTFCIRITLLFLLLGRGGMAYDASSGKVDYSKDDDVIGRLPIRKDKKKRRTQILICFVYVI